MDLPISGMFQVSAIWFSSAALKLMETACEEEN